MGNSNLKFSNFYFVSRAEIFRACSRQVILHFKPIKQKSPEKSIATLQSVNGHLKTGDCNASDDGSGYCNAGDEAFSGDCSNGDGGSLLITMLVMEVLVISMLVMLVLVIAILVMKTLVIAMLAMIVLIA